ncbi:MAG TPA: CdvA-like protein [Candidatus Bathyarchaeia archaeon]|nr:CdvA-like protein [Candidatus Bathyarchaeia archaeon]
MFKLISWKHSFRRLGEEFEVAKKKKQALDNLLTSGRISQSTYDSFNKEIDEAITEIERQQQALQEKMRTKVMELEDQIKTLEMLLANFEIQHVTGEVDEEVYQRQVDLLSIGLENSRLELNGVKEAVDQLSSGNILIQQETEPQPPENIVSKTEVEIIETPTIEKKLPEPPIEPVEIRTEDSETKETEAEDEQKQET